MKAILCRIIKIESLHPDYRVITDYDNGEDEPMNFGIVDDLRYLNKRWSYDSQKECDSQSFCAPGFIRVGDPVLRFQWLPDHYLQKYNFDSFSLFGEKSRESAQELLWFGGNKCPKRSQVIPTKMIWGESEFIRCLQTREYVRTDWFGRDYSAVLGFCQFQPPGEIDTWTDENGEIQIKSNRIF